MQGNTTDRARAGRRRLLLILAAFVAPIALAVVWYVQAPRLALSGSAHGTLIDPARPLEPFEVARPAADPFTLEDLRGQWSMIQVLGQRCGDACRQRLYETRQIHDALGEDRIRVQRVAVAGDGRTTPGLARVLDRHRRLAVLPTGAADGLIRQLPAAPAGTVFIVDPHGNLMMRFAPAIAADAVLEDMERLLELSRIG